MLEGVKNVSRLPPHTYSGPSEGLKIRGVPVLFGGHNLPPLVEIELTDLTKYGGDMTNPALPETTPL